MDLERKDTICAIATSPGQGAIAVIRLSGPDAFGIGSSVFFQKGKASDLSSKRSHTIHLGTVRNDEDVIDEVLVSIFKGPNSYTGEDVAEISCHGSVYIQKKIIELLISRGARQARAGEFTLRAFMNGKFDLSQAEAVADLIASSSKTAHDLALEQMRGGFSSRIRELREQLVNFTSLIELELDFSEEDVEFADRRELVKLLTKLRAEVKELASSFSLGNVLKGGIPVAIIGRPNVGKSTLLNAILNEERAIVSEIPGTTRDTVEDTIVINNYPFRFIDTAGLRHSNDFIESMGIERTYEKINEASIILYVFDVSQTGCIEIRENLQDFREHIEKKPGKQPAPDKKFIMIANKIDRLEETPKGLKGFLEMECIFVSAKRKENINLILESLEQSVGELQITDGSVVSSLRHYEALLKTSTAIDDILRGLESGVSSDLLTVDIRTALQYLGEITGEITNDEILGNIFSKFCIGK